MKKLVDEKYLDWMSILIEMNKSTPLYVDYVFICDVYAKDPRYKKRNMCIGQSRGLFRFNKDTLEVELLFAMEGDDNNSRFHRAAVKILNEYRDTKKFPSKAHYACG